MRAKKEEKPEKKHISPWKRSAVIYLIVWCVCLLWVWMGVRGGNAIWHTLSAFMLIFPVTNVITGYQLERRQDLGFWRWIALALLGVMPTAAQWIGFALADARQAEGIVAPGMFTFVFALCAGGIGILAGWTADRRL